MIELSSCYPFSHGMLELSPVDSPDSQVFPELHRSFLSSAGLMPEELGETVSSRGWVRQTTVLKGLYERYRLCASPTNEANTFGQSRDRIAWPTTSSFREVASG
jgi:hypothetical protein